MLNNLEEYDKMTSTESELWWYKILHEQVLNALRATNKSKDSAILDAACGTGGLMKRLIEQGFSNIQGFDVSPYAVSIAQEKTSKEIKLVDLKKAHTIYVENSFDVIVCNDALYFIEESQLPTVLAQLWSLLKEDGVLIINLPAFNFFKGMHDVTVDIHERWTYTKFRKVVKGSSLEKLRTQHTYWPFFLSPLILVARLFQKVQLKLNPDRRVVSDVQLPPLVLNKIFYNLTKWESYLPFSRWVGSSLFIVIRR